MTIYELGPETTRLVCKSRDTFVEDGGRRGKAEGDGINNFGGVWHVLKEG